MILYLDDNLIQLIKSNPTNQNLISAIENIATSRRLGRSFVLGSRSLIYDLSKMPTLSLPARTIYSKIYSKLTTEHQILTNFSFKCLVGDFPHVSYDFHDTTNTLKIPATLFHDPKLSLEPVLLCENENDGKFYSLCAKHYAHSKGLRTYNIIFDYQGGGGNTTSDAFDSLQKQNNRIFICVCDSDKSFPHSSLGDTAKQTLEVYDVKYDFSNLLILEYRMIENILPTTIIEKSVPGNPPKQASVSILKEVESTPHSDMRYYLNFKKGLTLSDALKSNMHYWSHLIDILMSKGHTFSKCCFYSCRTYHKQRKKSGQQKNDHCAPCLYYLFNPLGLDILKDCSSSFSSIDTNELKHSCHPSVFKNILCIGEYLFNYGCAPTPIHTP